MPLDPFRSMADSESGACRVDPGKAVRSGDASLWRHWNGAAELKIGLTSFGY